MGRSWPVRSLNGMNQWGFRLRRRLVLSQSSITILTAAATESDPCWPSTILIRRGALRAKARNPDRTFE